MDVGEKERVEREGRVKKRPVFFIRRYVFYATTVSVLQEQSTWRFFCSAYAPL